jgi:hypothetical protein
MHRGHRPVYKWNYTNPHHLRLPAHILGPYFAIPAIWSLVNLIVYCLILLNLAMALACSLLCSRWLVEQGHSYGSVARLWSMEDEFSRTKDAFPQARLALLMLIIHCVCKIVPITSCPLLRLCSHFVDHIPHSESQSWCYHTSQGEHHSWTFHTMDYAYK